MAPWSVAWPMPTEIRKTTPGETHIHNHGTVAGGETIAVDGDTAEYLVEHSGGYEYAETDAQDAESDGDTSESDSTSDADADVEGGATKDADHETNADLIESGECPWCDSYSGDSVGRHASAAHTEEWNAHKEATE